MRTTRLQVDLLQDNLEFAVFRSDEIRKLSVVKIITGLTFDALGHALPGGLNDSRMGSYGNSSDPCTTCFKVGSCPGHLGHIELTTLVYNPFFVKFLPRLLNFACQNCQKLVISDHVRNILELQLRLIDLGYIVESGELEVLMSENLEAEAANESNERILEIHELLRKGERNFSNHTKSTRAAKSAIVNAILSVKVKNCKHCKTPWKTIVYRHKRLAYFVKAADLKDIVETYASTRGQLKPLFAEECRSLLREMYCHHGSLLKLLYPILQSSETASDPNYSPMDIFFMDVIAVTPPNARPPNKLGNQIVENNQTGLYRSIIHNNAAVRVVLTYIKQGSGSLEGETQTLYQSLHGTTAHQKLDNAFQELQRSVNSLLDTNAAGIKHGKGVKQVLEKKDGLLRKHMMGKRVNYAARTVITPDPYINVDEIGVPEVFARKLNYPVAVTPWNVQELRRMVMNGPKQYPGANFIEDRKGYFNAIPADNAARRESMAKLLYASAEHGLKFVHRHVLNGDVMLLNRQPSLHRNSIMGHKVRVLGGEKTFRLHYSNCKSYNADFDGDEMNAHLPQNEVARSEAYNLANVANNYLVPKDGTPLGGLIQDQVISGVKLSIRGRFFNREDYQHLVFQALPNFTSNIKLLPPTILKPVRLWSGKQVLSTIILNIIPAGKQPINLDSHAKIRTKDWDAQKAREPLVGKLKSGEDMSESQVTIRSGELLTGVLDKEQYGATKFGLVHCMYELYGGEVSTNLLTAFTKVFTVFLQREGFTLGVQDILVLKSADRKRRKIIKKLREEGTAITASALGVDEKVPLDVLAEKMEHAYAYESNFRALLDRRYKGRLDRFTNEINNTCLPAGLECKFPENNLQLMVLSGAKGSSVNTMQISCLLGQIELEGQRPPLMISGKSLPSFTSFETSPKAGGFIDGRFLTGIQPQDFFFHCMAGREGLIDTAVKTSRSGYLQRCLVKHLEGLTVNYDLTVRDSDNSVVQFLYGEDGMDVLKSKFFNERFGPDFLVKNTLSVVRDDELKRIKDDEVLAKIARHNKSIRSWCKRKSAKTADGCCALSPFAHFSREVCNDPKMVPIMRLINPLAINPKTGRRFYDEKIIELWRDASAMSKNQYRKKYGRCPDPVTAIYQPDCTYGAVPEIIESVIKEYAERNAAPKTTVADTMYIKCLKAVAAPGEPVGLIAAQSIGEPSTQMTLNTFHFAGRGEMNVTLGIPRLREILMLASANIKTPSMDIPIKPYKQRAAEKLRLSLNRCTLKDVLHYVDIKVRLVLEPERFFQYELHFQLLPPHKYSNDFCVRPKRIIRTIKTQFPAMFIKRINASKKKTAIVESKKAEAEEAQADKDADEGIEEQPGAAAEGGVKTKQDPDNDSSSDESEEDATGSRRRARRNDENDYEDPEDVEELIDAEDAADVDDTIENEDDGDEMEDKNVDGDGRMFNDFTSDMDNHLWCKFILNIGVEAKKSEISAIVRNVASALVLNEVVGINRAIIRDEDNGWLKTDGINIGAMQLYNNVLDLNRLYSNNIHVIASKYGIEAAAQVIVKEIGNVFKVYGIKVDQRHLSLIADYMTFDGTFKPLSRKGMESSASPLQQMSFETCMPFMQNATAFGNCDDLYNPSSRIVAGLPIRNGTGAFDLLVETKR